MDSRASRIKLEKMLPGVIARDDQSVTASKLYANQIKVFYNCLVSRTSSSPIPAPLAHKTTMRFVDYLCETAEAAGDGGETEEA